MKVVLLCGGKGTRLGELTGGRLPKPLVAIGGRPIIWHIMDYYSRHGFSDFILCCGYMSGAFKKYFLELQLLERDIRVDVATGTVEFLSSGSISWTVTIVDTGLETQTAGRLARVSDYLEDEGPFFLTYGDGLSDVDLNALLAFHNSHEGLATITGVPPQGRFGELHLNGDEVVEMREKPHAIDRYINGGFMVLDREFVRKYCEVPDADVTMLERKPLESAAIDGQLMMYRHHGFWQCMDTARDWELLEQLASATEVPWQ